MDLLQSYFNPLKSDLYSDKNRWETTQIGRKIVSHTEVLFPDLKFTEIAVFNVPEYDGSKNSPSQFDCKIRALFYSFHHENLPRISDLGILQLMPTRKESFIRIQSVCEQLLHNGIIPFIIGGGHDLSYAVYKAYVSLDKFITLTTIDSKFDIGLEDDNLASFSHLGKMISHKPSHLFHFTNLGYQTYFVSSIANDMLQAMNFDTIRLGELKANFTDAEPIMRNTDFLSFDISAIQHAYAGANVYSSSNGLNGEDACKLMRYAGVSDKITAVGLFEYNQDLDVNNQTAYLLAEMLWYFLDGYTIRKDELNPNMNDCSKYTVAFEDGKNEITFYKSQKSGRWWIGIPIIKEGVNEPQKYYVACSYRDYEIANQGEIPERWLKTLNKFK
jgi:arginase family enzyme